MLLEKLQYRKFEILFFSQIIILFGSLLMPNNIFELISPILFYTNIAAGSLFLSFSSIRFNRNIIMLLLVFILTIFILSILPSSHIGIFKSLKLFTMFSFQSFVAYRVIKEVWKAKIVSKNVIFGVISGYVSLGLVGFFICLTIEIYHPNSFSGIYGEFEIKNGMIERLMYFSYITLMTVGFGDITPLTVLAQKATILIGLVGQFYLMIITAIVVGKYINQNHQNSKQL